jgi:4-hydroxybenzoate polyprenyltransferase
MKQKIVDFFSLIRWGNLVFIILTQFAFYYFIVLTNNSIIRLDWSNFLLIVVASVSIAAGGYIINDYFDYNIDIINKPQKLYIGKTISKRSAIKWHISLSALGIILSFYVSSNLHQRFYWLGFFNSAITVLLVFYSTTLKRKLLIGNVVVSLMIAWVILVIVLSQFQLLPQQNVEIVKNDFSKMFRIGIMYACFAFLINLMREIVKDMEDYIGDIKDGCKTLPIAWGFSVSKAFVGICTVVLITSLMILQLYVLQFEWYAAIAYTFFLIIIPLAFSLKILLVAQLSLQFHTLSIYYKGIMLIGILSMVFFKIYE